MFTSHQKPVLLNRQIEAFEFLPKLPESLTKAGDEAPPDWVVLVVELKSPESLAEHNEKLPNLDDRKVVALRPVFRLVRGLVGDVRRSVGQWSLVARGRCLCSKITRSFLDASNMCDVLVAPTAQAHQERSAPSVLRSNPQDMRNSVRAL